MELTIAEAKIELIKAKIKSMINEARSGNELTEEQMLSKEEVYTLIEMMKKAGYKEDEDYSFIETSEDKNESNILLNFCVDEFSIFVNTTKSIPEVIENFDSKIERIDLSKLSVEEKQSEGEAEAKQKARMNYSIVQFINLCEIIKKDGFVPKQIAINAKLLKKFFDENDLVKNKHYNYIEQAYNYKYKKLEISRLSFKIGETIVNLTESAEPGYSDCSLETEEIRMSNEKQEIYAKFKREIADQLIRKLERFKLLPIQVSFETSKSPDVMTQEGEYTVYDFLAEAKPILNGVFDRPNIVCEDGYELSVQASLFRYSEKDENDNYKTFEVKGPEEDEIICSLDSYMVDISPKRKVYAYVPYNDLMQLIQYHGGINVEETRKRIQESPYMDHGENDEMEAFVKEHCKDGDEETEELWRMAWKKRKKDEELKKAQELEKQAEEAEKENDEKIDKDRDDNGDEE